MSKYLLILVVLMGLYACEKETLTKKDTWVDLTYRIQTNDSNLQVNLMRGVYNETVKGNIGIDTILAAPGLYNIPATVLNGLKVRLYGMSTTGPNFQLSIVDASGNILKKTESHDYHPANQLDTVDRWISVVEINL